MSPRPYSSPRRQAEAARTREAIVDAAATLFAREGYLATTMKAIAEEAQVSVQSVHLAGPKAALLIAGFERMFAGDEGRHSLSERPAMQEIMARADAGEAIAAWLDFVADANRRTARLWRAMFVAAETDDLAADAVADLERRRRADMGIAAGWAAQRGLVREGEEHAVADELSYVVGPETYDFFVMRAGWSDERYRAWLEGAIGHVLRPDR